MNFFKKSINLGHLFVLGLVIFVFGLYNFGYNSGVTKNSNMLTGLVHQASADHGDGGGLFCDPINDPAWASFADGTPVPAGEVNYPISVSGINPVLGGCDVALMDTPNPLQSINVSGGPCGSGSQHTIGLKTTGFTGITSPVLVNVTIRSCGVDAGGEKVTNDASHGIIIYPPGYTPPPVGFSFTCDVGSQTVTQGGSTSYTVSTSNPVGGFNSPVNITLSGTLPSEGTITSPGGSIASTPGSTLVQVNTTAGTPVNSYTLTFQATGGGVTKTCTSQLVVNAPIIYSYTVSPASLNYVATQNGSLPASQNITLTNTGNQSLTISANKTQSWLTLSAGSVTIAPGNNAVITGSANTTALAPGVYPDTITFSEPNTASQTTGVTYTITAAPDFSCSVTTPSQTGVQGFNASYNLSFSYVNGFGSITNISTSSVPAGPSGSGSITPPATTTSVSVPTGAVSPNTYTLTFTATGGGITHGCGSATLTVNPVPVYSYTRAPASLSYSVTQNAVLGTVTPSATQNITLTNTGNQSLTISASKTQAWLTLSTGSVTIAAGNSAVVTASVNTTALAPASYPDTITFSEPNTASQTTGVTYTVNAIPNFTFSCDTASQTITQGNSTSYTVSASNATGGVVPPITVTLLSVVPPTGTITSPGGSIASFTAPNNTTLIQVNTTGATAANTYTLTFQGVASGVTKTCTSSLTVTRDLVSIAISPTSSTINIAGTQPYTVTATYTDSSTAQVAPSSIFTSANPGIASMNGPGPGNSTATGVSSGGPIVITASFTDGVNKTAQASLTVTAKTIDFSCNTLSQTVTQGGSTSYTVTVNSATGGITPPVAITLFNVNPATGTITSPGGSIATIPGSTLIQVNTTSATPAGSYDLTFKAIAADGTSATCKAPLPKLVVNALAPTVDIKADGFDNPPVLPDKDKKDGRNLTWTSSNATSCLASGDNPSGTWTGSKALNSSGSGENTGKLKNNTSYTFTITCTGPGGSAADSVIVSVGKAPPGDFTFSCDTATQTVTQGNSTSYTVSASNAVGGVVPPVTVTLSNVNPATGTITSPGSGSIASFTAPNNTTLIQVNTTGATPVSPPNYTLTFQGVASGVTKTCTSQLVVNSPPVPPNPPLPPISAGNAICNQVTLDWTDNSLDETGFRIYRNTSGTNPPPNGDLIGSTGPHAGTGSYTPSPAYTDNTAVGGQDYYYWVSSYNASGESTRVALTNPTSGHIFVNTCAPNLSTSDKDIISINGSPVITSPNYNGGAPCSSSMEVANNQSAFVAKDILTFRVNVCNTGNGDTPAGVVVEDQLTSLTQPSSGWNFRYTVGCTVSGSSPVITGSAPNQKLTFTLTSPIVKTSGACGIIFNAQVTAPVVTQPYYHFFNCINLTTPGITGSNSFCASGLFTKNSGTPSRQETPP